MMFLSGRQACPKHVPSGSVLVSSYCGLTRTPVLTMALVSTLVPSPYVAVGATRLLLMIRSSECSCSTFCGPSSWRASFKVHPRYAVGCTPSYTSGTLLPSALTLIIATAALTLIILPGQIIDTFAEMRGEVSTTINAKPSLYPQPISDPKFSTATETSILMLNSHPAL